MTIRNALPFEFPFRWNALRQFVDMPDEAVDYFDERDRMLEDFLARLMVPSVFHWPMSVDELVNVRVGPGEFSTPGPITTVAYVWDTAPLADATIEWYFDGVLTMTHTLTGDNIRHVEITNQGYTDEVLIAIVTSVDSTASGLTASLFRR